MPYSPELGGLIYQVASQARREGGISFAGGYPDPALFDVEGLREAFNGVFDSSIRVALSYGEREGYAPLRERLAAFSSTESRQVQAEEVVITNGGQQGIEMAVRTLVKPGDVVFTDSPTFSTALQTIHLAGAKFVNVAADADGVDPEDLEAKLQHHRPKLLYVVPSYSNPAGSLLTRERRLRVLQLAVQYDFIVLEDDPYGHIWFDEPSPPKLLSLTVEVPGAAERLIHVSSLSKLVAPGLRVGWVIPPESLRRPMVLTKQSTDIHSALPTQHALVKYWDSGRLGPHVERVRTSYRGRAMEMDAGLRTHAADVAQFHRPRGGMFVWVRVPACADTRDLLAAARAEKVYFVPGVAFYPEEPDASTMRLSFATTSAEQMDDGMRRLGRAIKAYVSATRALA